MANHCVYATCFDCGHEYCERGCGYDWCKESGCGHHADDPAVIAAEREALKRGQEELARNAPEGWF